MANQLLEVKGLSVKVEDKEILHGINLEIKKGMRIRLKIS